MCSLGLVHFVAARNCFALFGFFGRIVDFSSTTSIEIRNFCLQIFFRNVWIAPDSRWRRLGWAWLRIEEALEHPLRMATWPRSLCGGLDAHANGENLRMWSGEVGDKKTFNTPPTPDHTHFRNNWIAPGWRWPGRR